MQQSPREYRVVSSLTRRQRNGLVHGARPRGRGARQYGPTSWQQQDGTGGSARDVEGAWVAVTRHGCERGEDSEGCTRLREGCGRKSEAEIRTDFTKQGLGTATREGRSGRLGDFGQRCRRCAGKPPRGTTCGLAPDSWQQLEGVAAEQGDLSPSDAVSQWIAHQDGASAQQRCLLQPRSVATLVLSPSSTPFLECNLDPPSRSGPGLGHNWNETPEQVGKSLD